MKYLNGSEKMRKSSLTSIIKICCWLRLFSCGLLGNFGRVLSMKKLAKTKKIYNYKTAAVTKKSFFHFIFIVFL